MTSLREDDRTRIIYRKWEALSLKAILLLVHGLGGHSARWQFLADFFLKYGISSYAIELKGFGRTRELKGHIDSFGIYLDDIRRLHDIIREECGNKKIFLVGESMGALIAYLMAIAHPEIFDGLVCISPAFRSRLNLGLSDYVKIFFSLIFSPRRQLTMPFSSDMCTRDTEYQKTMDSSESEHRFATPKMLFNIALAQVRARILKESVKMPVLFLVAEEDRLVLPRASIEVFNGLKADAKEMVRYPGMYHALSIDLGRELVFEDILKWMRGGLAVAL